MTLMPKPNSFEGLVDVLPGSWQYYLGLGLRYFLRNQEAEKVDFVRLKNGYAIEVKADEESVEDAEEFWVEYVEDKI